MRALVLLGDLLAAVGRRDEARDVWESFLKLDPDDASGSSPRLEEVEATMPRR
jgi:cytochrome c-type biogenesis protein CcmH/NrfG